MLLRKSPRRPLYWLSLVAAFSYWSWPLGFALNRPIALHSLASKLEAPGQPYSWLFVSLDVLAGVTALILGICIVMYYRPIWAKITGGGLALFGSLVTLAALIPLDCDPTVLNCSPLWHYPTLVVHGFASITSVLGLLAGLSAVAYQAIVRNSSGKVVKLVFALVVAWIIFGAGSLLSLLVDFHTNLLQYFFITVCSLSIPSSVLATEILNQGGSRL